jgi:hypothetical protein
MNQPTRCRNVIRKSILLLASIAISTFAWGQQHRTESKEPAEHASKPIPSRSPAKEPTEHPSKPTPNSGVAKAPVHTPAPTRVSQPSEPHRAGNPRDSASTRGGRRAENAAGKRAPEPVVDHIGDISEYRRSTSHPTPASLPASLTGGATANPRPSSHSRSNNRSINRDGMQIQHNLRGGRMIVSERNGERIVTTGGGRGYVQRAYVNRGGRSYYSRTYYDGRAYRVGVYRGYDFGGHHYYGYYPDQWYHSAYYGWAYRPWGTSVSWSTGPAGWGWAGAPWFRVYGGYFAPYPVYSSAAFWLTDYLIAANLQAAYAARPEASADEAAAADQGQADYAGPPTLTPEVKDAIAEEVQAQLAAEQQQTSGSQSDGSSDGQARDAQAQSAPTNSEAPPALDAARRTFVVSSNMTVTSDGQECELTAGDILMRLTNTPDADQNVKARVAATKKKDCAIDKQVVVSVEALQDMRNHFDEQLDDGMKTLAEKQGTGGLPKAPDTGVTASDVPAPPPDTTAAKDLTDQEAAGDRAEMQAKQEAAGGSAGGQVIMQTPQGTSLGEIARQLRAKKQQDQAQSDPSH